MANDLSISLRVPSMLMARLEALRPIIEGDPDLAYLGEDLSRSMLVRLAVQRGVEALEALYGVVPANATSRITAKIAAAQKETEAFDRERLHSAITETLRPAVTPARTSAKLAAAALESEAAPGQDDAVPVGAAVDASDETSARRPG